MFFFSLSLFLSFFLSVFPDSPSIFFLPRLVVIEFLRMFLFDT